MIQVFHCSEPGGHATNEDAFAVRPHPQDPECYLAMIADGQGGRAGGAAAAQRACSDCLETAVRHSTAELLLPATWIGVLRAVDEAVTADPVAGFTTVVAFALTKSHLCGASCGDSAAVLLDAGRPGEVLTARQHKNPPVGSGAAAIVAFAARLRSPWTVLAMSDGVWKYTGWENVLKDAAERHGEDILRSLRDRAKLRLTGSLQDDFTLVVLHHGGPDGPEP